MNLFPDPPPAVEVTADQQAITEGWDIIARQGRDNWRLGELASQLHASGHTDEQIAELWECSRQKVSDCRRIWDRFSATAVALRVRHRFAWRNWREMAGWDDAEDCVRWAAETEASWRELVAWRRAKRGEPLQGAAGAGPEIVGTERTESPAPPAVVAREPDPPLVVPAEKTATAVAQQPAPQPDVLKAVRDSVKALKTAVAHVQQEDRAKIARNLRKLADELDPPKQIRFIPPTVDEVAEYCRERGNTLDPQEVWDYYNTQGWNKANGQPVQDWRGCVRTIEARERKEKQKHGTNTNRAQQREAANADAFAAVLAADAHSTGGQAARIPLLDEGDDDVHPASGDNMGNGAADVPF